MGFIQTPPRLENTWESDKLLQSELSALLPNSFRAEIFDHLRECGDKAVGDWLEWSRQAENNKPYLIQYDPWGNRIDRIEMPEGWMKLEAEAARHGIVSCGYERKYAEFSRVYQAALLYLFHPSSAFVSCPLAMTDGAARALELYGSEEQKKKVLSHLLSRDPKLFWTSGQWMTERSGGSDVSGTETLAEPDGSMWRLTGVKWFTSATTSPVAMLLARTPQAEPGSRGLSLFMTKLRDENGKLQNIQVLRLKNKLGTDALPTAELSLQGTPAQAVGELGHGVRKISALFNITRIYNSVCATAHARRALDWAKSYALVRKAFGQRLSEHPLHREVVDYLEREFAKCLRLTFFVSWLLGKDETGRGSDMERKLLRALTPVVKLFTARKRMEITSEVVEIFAGAGYVEDTGIPRLLRDAQVFSIWEGTTNVLSLDLLRALSKENAAQGLSEFFCNGSQALGDSNLKARLAQVVKIVESAQDPSVRDRLEAQARVLSFNVAEITAEILRTKGLCDATRG
ncbi:MAG: acyl-CoA dehydrogenase family protein [Bdellovibrionaceae bacterium]|nr:acyl-CoA dehydrogenase family protein [Pseudobdellovibrionaceae bacterium]